MGYNEIATQAKDMYERYSGNPEYQPFIDTQWKWIKAIMHGSRRYHIRRVYIWVHPDPYPLTGLPPVVMFMWKPHSTMGDQLTHVIELGGKL